MEKKSKIINDDINLIDLAKIIWDGKWKIVISIAIASIFAFIMQITQKAPVKDFTAITEIAPINTLEEYKYSAINDYYNEIKKTTDLFDNELSGINFKITKNLLLNLYIEVLNEKLVFKKSLHKNKFLDIKEYASNDLYYEEIEKIAGLIKVHFPKQDKEITTKKELIYDIRFNYNDEKKWKKFLITVNELANQAVKENLRKKFEVLLFSEKIRIEYEIEDSIVLTQNLWDDYETKSINRISYLKEQSAIAEKLGIAKNTFEVQTFGDQNGLLSNVKTDSPFYLRGYEAINKEIELILLRTNKEAFISGLLELNQKIRKLEQAKSIKRLKLLLDATPLAEGTSLIDGKMFYAANFATTRFVNNNKISQKNFMIQGILIGLIIGFLYTLISNRLQSQKTTRKK